MKKQCGKAIIALISLVIMQQSAHGFDELMNKTIAVFRRTENVSLQVKNDCGFYQYPTYQRITTCNNALDEVNRLLSHYKSLDHELKRYVLIPRVAEIKSQIKSIDTDMQKISGKMELHWRPLQKKLTVAKALATQRKEMINLFIDRCEVSSDTYSLLRWKSEPKQKIDICNQVFDALEESESTYSAAIKTLLLSGYSAEDMMRFKPKRTLTVEDVKYWYLLKSK